MRAKCKKRKEPPSKENLHRGPFLALNSPARPYFLVVTRADLPRYSTCCGLFPSFACPARQAFVSRADSLLPCQALGVKSFLSPRMRSAALVCPAGEAEVDQSGCAGDEKTSELGLFSARFRFPVVVCLTAAPPKHGDQV